MNKLHITLVGGQTAPVYQGIVYSNPDKVILIHSSDTKDQAEQIKSEIVHSVELVEFPPVNLEKIFKKVDELAAKIDENVELSLNITSGTKPWALVFYSKFLNRFNTSVIYVDQNAKVWNFVTKKNVLVNFDMDAQFRLYGNPLTKFLKFEDFTQDDFNEISRIEQMRSFNYGDFNLLTDLFENKPHLTQHQLPSGSYISWNSQTKSFELSLESKKGNKKMVFSSPNSRRLVLNSGWFELKVARILKKWNKVKELRLNCLFPTLQNSPKNEVDIIADIGSKLLFVECKTKLHKETDIDKFASAVRNYGGTASKALLVTWTPITDKAIEKCKDNGIMYFSLGSATDSFPADKMLISLLESNLLNINPR